MDGNFLSLQNSELEINSSSLNSSETSQNLPQEFTQISSLSKWCIIVYIIFFILAAAGNSVAFFSVACRKRVGKSRIPLLIINLCVADLIVTFFLMPTEIFWRLTIAWKGGNILCKLTQFGRAIGLYLSCNVVICISIDRYYSIVHPLKLVGAVKRVKRTLIWAWIVSAVFAAPQMFVYHVASHPIYPQFRQCVTKAFLKETGLLNELVYNVGSVSALYFIPLFVIIYTYTKILWELRKNSREQGNTNSFRDNSNPSQQNPDETGFVFQPNLTVSNPSPSNQTRIVLRCTANQKATLNRARSRTLRLTFLILLTFIVCWTPYVYMTLWYMVDRSGASQVDPSLQEALFIMTIANSVINPLIYGTVGARGTFLGKLSTCGCFSAPPRSRNESHDYLGITSIINVGNRVERIPQFSIDQSPSPRMQVVTLNTSQNFSGV